MTPQACCRFPPNAPIWLKYAGPNVVGASDFLRTWAAERADGLASPGSIVLHVCSEFGPGTVSSQVYSRSEFAEPAMNSIFYAFPVTRTAISPIWWREPFQLARKRVPQRPERLHSAMKIGRDARVRFHRRLSCRSKDVAIRARPQARARPVPTPRNACPPLAAPCPRFAPLLRARLDKPRRSGRPCP